MNNAQDQGFHISSIVVRCQPGNLDAIMGQVASIEGVEVHGSDPAGKFVALLELDSEKSLVDTITRIELTRGVINTSMVYHHTE